MRVFFKRKTAISSVKNPKPTHVQKSDKTPNKKPVFSFRLNKTSLLRALWFSIGIFALIIAGLAFFSPLVKDVGKLDYFDYVSELRSNVLIAQTENYALRVYAVEKETPYNADGVRREMTTRAEVYFTAPSGDKTTNLTFTINGKTHSGEMSYDNVKEEYFFSVSTDLSKAERLDFHIKHGKEEMTFQAKTIKTASTLSAKTILEKLQENEPSVFQALTDENGFVGEINIRLISDDTPYYYVGLIEKDGKTRAYLLTSDTGRVLAKRQS